VFLVSRERNGRASRRFRGAVGYKGELSGNQERLGQTMHLPWVCPLILDLSQNYYQIAFCSLRGAHP
jgi:hypothetical protein